MRPSSLLAYHRAADRLLRADDALATLPLNELTVARVDDVVRTLSQRYSSHSAHASYDLLRHACDLAERQGEIVRNPASRVDPARYATARYLRSHPRI